MISSLDKFWKINFFIVYTYVIVFFINVFDFLLTIIYFIYYLFCITEIVCQYIYLLNNLVLRIYYFV